MSSEAGGVAQLGCIAGVKVVTSYTYSMKNSVNTLLPFLMSCFRLP